MKFPADLRLSLDHDGQAYAHVPVDRLSTLGVPPSVILAAYKTGLCAEVNAAAERLRSAVTTPGSGQAMEYQEVQAQAFTALAIPRAERISDPVVLAAKFPMLAASIGLDTDPTTGAKATDVYGVAESVQAAYASWGAFGAEIRRIRLTAIAQIAAAETPEAAEAASRPAWPPLA